VEDLLDILEFNVLPRNYEEGRNQNITNNYHLLDKMHTRKPTIYASNVAAFIGKNPYKSQNEAFANVFWNDRFLTTFFQHSGRKMIKQGLGQSTKRFLEEAVQSSVSATKESGIKATIKHMKTALEEETLKVAVGKCLKEEATKVIMESLKPRVLNNDDNNKPIVQKFSKSEAKKVLNDLSEAGKENCIDADDVTPLVRAVRQHLPVMIREITQKGSLEAAVKSIENDKDVIREVNDLKSKSEKHVIKQRGCEMEQKVIDEIDVNIKGQQMPGHYVSSQYNLFGKIDGLDDGHNIHEVKVRRRYWSVPPEYDMIQLRVYMKIFGEKDGVLTEKFPDGKKRETFVPWSDFEWENLHNDICAAISVYKRVLENVDDVFNIMEQFCPYD